MRNPEDILNSLPEHSEDSSYEFERLYGVLFNEEVFYAIYQRIYNRTGSMAAGVDGQTIDGMSIDRIKQLVDSPKSEAYQPALPKRAHIPKKNGKRRSLGIPSFNDKLVQEVVRMVLEAIYEGNFKHTSYGFRPGCGCHAAFISIQKSFSAVK